MKTFFGTYKAPFPCPGPWKARLRRCGNGPKHTPGRPQSRLSLSPSYRLAPMACARWNWAEAINNLLHNLLQLEEVKFIRGLSQILGYKGAAVVFGKLTSAVFPKSGMRLSIMGQPLL